MKVIIKPSKFLRKLFKSLIWERKNNQKEIWLTFDDGPHPKTTDFILKTLKEENIKATFFLVGEQIETFPDLYKRIKLEGHTIGNHTYSHLNGWITKNKIYFNDIEKCQKLMPENLLFRPPYGKLSFWQIKKLKKQFKLVLWDVLSGDYKKNITPFQVKKNILKHSESGSIIVMHNNKNSLAKIKPILKSTIRELKRKKFKFRSTW